MSAKPMGLAELRKKAPRQKMRQGPKPAQLVEPLYKKLGLLVLEMRERRGMTQQQVATEFGWGRASIANIEGGKQRVLLHDLPRFAAVFRVPLGDILGELFNV